MKKIIVGISAADGVQIGVRLLTLLREIPDVETHLVMSRIPSTIPTISGLNDNLFTMGKPAM